MKASLLLLVLLSISTATIAQRNYSQVKVLSACDGYFHFKISKDLMGATVEVYDASKNLISSQTVTTRKMMIDFYDAKAGQYEILISNQHAKNSFDYTLVDPTPRYVAVSSIDAIDRSVAGK